MGSRTTGSARRAATAWEAPVDHEPYEALVAEPRVAVVFVATPHTYQLRHAVLTIVAGKHGLVERPVVLDADETAAIGDAAAHAGAIRMAAMWTLFLPKFGVVRQVLEPGALGRVVAAQADVGERFDEPHRILRPELAGLPPLDLGAHAVTFRDLGPGGARRLHRGRHARPERDQRPAGHRPGHAGRRDRPLNTAILADTAMTASDIDTEGRIGLGTRHRLPAPVAPHQRGGDSVVGGPMVERDALHLETGSPLRPWADPVGTMELMDRVRSAGPWRGLDFGKAGADRDTSG